MTHRSPPDAAGQDPLITRLADALRDDMVAAVEKAVSDAVTKSLPLPEPEPLLTIEQVARRLSVHEATVRRLVKVGQLKGTKVLGSLRFDPRDVELYVDTLRGEEPAGTSNTDINSRT